MSFLKDFDTILNNILADWQNQFPEVDISQGSLIYMKSACLASIVWGLYRYQEWISRQVFPDTSDTAQLDHWAWIWGISRKANESDDDLLARLLARIQQPPAGGNADDYVSWALEITNILAAYCYPAAQGPGTVDVVILADESVTGSEIPSSHAMSGTNTSVTANKLIDSGADFTASGDPVRVGDIAKNTSQGAETTVTGIVSATELTLAADIFTATPQNYEIVSLTVQVDEYIDTLRPVTASLVRILAPTKLTQAVTMTVSGSVDTAEISADIQAYMNNLKPDETLFSSQIMSLAIQAGADNASVSVPAADVVPGEYEMIRPGTIAVTMI